MSIAVSHNLELRQLLNQLFSKLTGKYLINHDSHHKDCISFVDIRNMMILHFKKYLFFTFLQSTLQTGIENINGPLQNGETLTRILVITQC